DHFAEIVSWALAHPESAVVVEAEQLELPVPRFTNGLAHDDPSVVAAVLDRIERIQPPPASGRPESQPSIALSFSQLHDFDVCPVRYRFSQVWGVPAPPDELQPRHVRAAGSTELGAAVHEVLAAWHNAGGDLPAMYRGPEAGREMLARYLDHPLARARTMAVEAGFKMAIGATRVKGLVDRVCEMDGRVALIDFKTNASLDHALLEAYTLQLRIYGLAARRGQACDRRRRGGRNRRGSQGGLGSRADHPRIHAGEAVSAGDRPSSHARGMGPAARTSPRMDPAGEATQGGALRRVRSGGRGP